MKLNGSAKEARQERKKILLVEDNPDDEALALEAFRQVNFRDLVEVVRDGQEAVDRAPKIQPDLILLDLKLPKISGIEVLRKLRSDVRTKWVPVVLFTSSKLERDRKEGYEAGANSFVRKPIDFKDFVKAIKEICAYWMILNQGPSGEER